MNNTDSDTDTDPQRTARSPLLVVAAAVLAVALGFALWAGYGLYSAETDQDAARAAERDNALAAARSGVATFNTLDYREVDKGLDRWLAGSTGGLREELAQTREASKQRVIEAKTTSEGRVTDAALTDLDTERGTAKAIAAVEIVVIPDGGQPATKRSRFQAELTRTESGWLLSALGQVPMSTA
ncbi:hypothetical protein [Actinokineospora iranica]|nr:hypothetical protein [Actinokineospora iranica]